MIARFATLVFSLVVGITPIAPEVCELLCASSMPAHHMAAQDAHDACGPQISQLPACCADADRTPAPPVSAAKVVVNPPVMLARSATSHVIPPVVIDVAPGASSPPTPVPLVLRIPLRL
jgi:hypothetical protein